MEARRRSCRGHSRLAGVRRPRWRRRHSYLNEPLFKKPDFYVNVAFQTFFCAAFMAAFLTDKPKKA